jgi:hypothetical protein
MRVLAGALLAMIATGPDLKGSGGFAVTVDVHAAPRACAVVSTATIVAYDASVQRDLRYRFVRSDGSVSHGGRLSFVGTGAVAQAVRDEWKPRGAAPWVALEITEPERMRSQRVAVTPRCPRRFVAASR